MLDGSNLESLIDGLERNGLLDDFSNSAGSIGNILTGYIGSESFLIAVVNVVKKLKGLNPKCRYICDPVLGDMGRFYVPKELVDVYQRNVLPLADVITPNQFEVEQLTGISIRSIQDAQRACRSLHDSGVEIVLITSVVFPDNVDNSGDCLEVRDIDITNDIGPVSPLDSIGMFTSQRKLMRQRLHVKDEKESEDFIDEQWILYTPRLAGNFTGTGDVCAAIFLGLTSDGSEVGSTPEDRTPLACSLEKLAGTCILSILPMTTSSIISCLTRSKLISGSMHAIVKRTADAAAVKQANVSSTAPNKAHAVSSLELQLIQSRDDIINPPELFRAMRVPCEDRQGVI